MENEEADLITKADLQRHLPRKLRFGDRTLRLAAITTVPSGKTMQDHLGYVVSYRDEELDGFMCIGRLPRYVLYVLLTFELRMMYWRLVRGDRSCWPYPE